MGSNRKMDVQYALGECYLLIRGDILEVLLPEDHELPLCNEQRQLVQPFLRQFRELNARDFGTNIRAKVVQLGVGSEQVGLGWVGSGARVDVIYKAYQVCSFVFNFKSDSPKYSSGGWVSVTSSP